MSLLKDALGQEISLGLALIAMVGRSTVDFRAVHVTKVTDKSVFYRLPRLWYHKDEKGLGSQTRTTGTRILSLPKEAYEHLERYGNVDLYEDFLTELQKENTL